MKELCLLMLFLPACLGGESQLKFPWGVNFKYNGQLHHNIDRVWVVTKVPIPTVESMQLGQNLLSTTPPACTKANKEPFEDTARRVMCASTKTALRMLQWKEHYYIKRAKALLGEELDAILPQFPATRPKRGLAAFIPLISSLGMVAFEKLSAYLQRKRHKAIQKSLKAMHKRHDNLQNVVKQYEQDFLMYGQYTVENLDRLAGTFHTLQSNFQNWAARLEAVQKNVILFSHELIMYINMMEEKHGSIYRELITSLKALHQAIAILSRGYLPSEIFPPTRLKNITETVRATLIRDHPEYQLALTDLSDYYDMQMVTFGVSSDKELVITFPILIKQLNSRPLDLYDFETIPVPVKDENVELNTYTQVIPVKPYLAVSYSHYIELKTEELRMCKTIHFKYYCEEVFLVKHKSKYSCASALFFNLDMKTIMANCQIKALYNATVHPSILDGGSQLVLGNLEEDKRLICRDNDDLAIPLPPQTYVLVNRSLLCYCDIDAGFSYVMQTLGSCDGPSQPINLEFTFNMAFFNTFEEELTSQNFSPPSHPSFEPVFPVSLPNDPFLLHMPTLSLDSMRAILAKNSSSFLSGGRAVDANKETTREQKFFTRIGVKIFKFIMACLTVGCIGAIGYLALKHSKLRTYVSGLSLAALPKVSSQEYFEDLNTCQDSLVALIMTGLVALGVLIYCVKMIERYLLKRGLIFNDKSQLFLFVEHGCFYVPIRILTTTGTFCLFKATNTNDPASISLKQNWGWDELEIEWNANINYKGNTLMVPSKVFVPLPFKFMLRRMMREQYNLQLMVKQGVDWTIMGEGPVMEPPQGPPPTM